ncbi:D-alanine--D-alanine ligase A [Rhodovastum atsumiense]|uniref:D-alanine--D-alanine ligase n=1 Tax=Rhodovastum atsumiense TaxID=504468 RepID=A0A5M6IZ89_9PROT|nr:D-alanine--D-alanine ligase family protein [Rhodovastum atsumiense]KAA5612668.1 D-alanine--D-alanine ligase [Rhodovastum atsumiense]CAH2602794.1 D-alanine--D-alanine ligase A [Rhodovastum atsumiense]
MTNPSGRLRIAVLFGGCSAEHDVSVLSATNVLRALDPAKYEVVPVFVTRDGRWLSSRFEGGVPETPEAGTEFCLVPGGAGRMIAIPEGGAPREVAAIDLLFPVLHGLPGEDGAVQGLADVARVPLVGCGILGSATSLDKDITKRLLREAGLPVARALTIRRGAVPGFADVREALGLPVFIKPARQGSSVGVSKVATEAEYEAALAEGFRHDGKLLAEEFIRGREIECAVLEDPEGGLFVSRPGEIVPAASHGFYSYDAKYIDADGAALIVPAAVPDALEARIRGVAAEAFRVAGCDGMARVDVFVTSEPRVLVNEINTIPGFTDISMYPRAMAASGIGSAELIDRLVAHALVRAARTF